MKDNFIIVIETLHLPDKGNQFNVHELGNDKLKMREIVMIDIAGDSVSPTDYKALEDPSKFRSLKSGQ